jgi:hypothetical protein
VDSMALRATRTGLAVALSGPARCTVRIDRDAIQIASGVLVRAARSARWAPEGREPVRQYGRKRRAEGCNRAAAALPREQTLDRAE